MARGTPPEGGRRISSERLGTVVVVIVVVAVLLTLNQGIGDAVLGRAKGAWCSLSGAGCPDEIDVPNRYVASGPCRRPSPEAVVDATLIPLEIPGGPVEGVRVARSDGSVAVTLKARPAAARRLGLDPRSVDLGRRDLADGAGGEVAIDARGAGARTWVFASPEEADHFVDDVQSWSQETITAQGIRLTGGGLGRVFEAAYRAVIARRVDFRFPAPHRTYFAGGLRVAGVAGVDPATAYASIDGRLSAPDAGVFSHQSRHVTLVYRLAVTAEASRVLHALAAGVPGEEAQLVAALTLDGGGNPIRLALTGRGRTFAPLTAAASWRDLRATARGLAAARAATGPEMWELETSLDLTDPTSSAVAIGWLRAALLGSSPELSLGLPAASRDLVRALDEEGVFVLREYEPEHEPFGSSVATLRAGAEAPGGLPRAVSALARARYRVPGGAFVDVGGCGG